MSETLFGTVLDRARRLRDVIVELDGQPVGAERALAEISFRLNRASYGYRRALETMTQLEAALPPLLGDGQAMGGSSAGPQIVRAPVPLSELFQVVPFYAEGCYVQLWRIVERCNANGAWASLFPELGGFKPAGVREARNNRFEHVDHNQLASWGWSDHGPRLYPQLILKRGAVDKGLVVNVEQYLYDLDRRLSRLSSRLKIA